MAIKSFIKELSPPLLWRLTASLRRNILRQKAVFSKNTQDLDVYWEAQMAEILETWGEGNTWNEIQLLLVNCDGNALDIACGTGKVMSILDDVTSLEIYGCDISDLLIKKALERGIQKENLMICDATSLPYESKHFKYSYSIGSLEHFTESGIDLAISEAARTTSKASFHMMPVSKSGKDEGWLKTYQSFHNCSVDWWRPRFKKHFNKVLILDSKWEDDISAGKWFLCWH